MNPASDPKIVPFPKDDQPPQANGPVVTSLVCLCNCSDGKLRAIQFQGKQAKKIYGYIEHIQGGRVQIMKEPLLLVTDTLVVRQAIDAAVTPPAKLTWWQKIQPRISRMTRMLGNSRSQAPGEARLPIREIREIRGQNST